MKINPELFVIPKGENFILYLPLEKNTLMEVTPGTVPLLKNLEKNIEEESQKEIVKIFQENKIIVADNYLPKMLGNRNTHINSYKPTSVTLLPTSDCNLGCIYCYASSGENKIEMSSEVASKSIDYIIKNALELNQKTVGVSFHGGGEPFMNFNLMKYAVSYAKDQTKTQNLRPHFSVVSNGVLNSEQLEWIVENNVNLNISLDGPEDVQNIQRPLRGGGQSYNHVMKSIKFLDAHKHPYAIRSTITDHNVNKLVEMVQFFKEKINLSEVHFEPVFECGRCEKTQTREPDSELFLEKFIEAKEYGKKIDVNVRYSGGRFNKTVDHFCGAAGSNFFVTMNGDVTTCLEVSGRNDPRKNIFFVGKFEDSNFKVEEDKVKYLKSRTVQNLPNCTDCYSKYSCAGDCLAKVTSGASLFDTSKNTRCEINRGVLLYEINEQLNNSNLGDKNGNAKK